MAQTVNSPKNRDDFRSEAGQAFDRAKDLAADAVQKGKDFAGPLADKAGEAASMVGKKVDQATSAVGSGMKNVADRIKGAGPHDGYLGQATQTVADTIKEGGEYLEHGGLSGMTKDVTNLIRRNPVPAVLLGLGLGYLIGRMLRS